MIEGNIKREQEQQIEVSSLESQQGVSTESFEIRLNLKQNTLQIFLQDYISWKSYSKSITRQNFTNNINSRLDLQDIFYALARKKNEKLYLRYRQVVKRQMIKPAHKYAYGDTIYNQFSQFQILQGGIINVCSKIIHARGDKSIQKIQKSCIVLNEIGIIDHKKMYEVMYKIVNIQVHRQYQAQIENLKAEIRQLKSERHSKISQLRINRDRGHQGAKLSEKFPIFVNLGNGLRFQTQVRSQFPVKYIKKRLSLKYGIKWTDNYLQFSSKELRSMKSIGQSRIFPNCQIFVRLKKTNQITMSQSQ